MIKRNKDIILIILIGVLLYTGYLYNNSIKNDIASNKGESITKVYKVEIGGKIKCSLKYKFYYEGKLYFNSHSIPCTGYRFYENKYYKVIFSTKNLNHSKILLNEEITDSIIIKSLNFQNK